MVTRIELVLWDEFFLFHKEERRGKDMTIISRKDRKFKFETLQLHVGQEQADPATDSRAVPIYQTTSYVFHNSQHAADCFGLKDAGNIYGRLTNSTQGAFEDRIAALESGVAAISELAHKHGLPVVVDNTFGTPYLIRPIEHGADIVVHSATKFIGGHGTTLGGVIVDGGTFDWEKSGRYPWISQLNPSYHGVRFTQAAGKAAFATYIHAILLRDTGATLSPFNAFLLLQGTKTLSLRIDRYNENTKKVVEFLIQHPKVEKVNHPSLKNHPDHELYQKYFPNGGASIFTIEIKGGQEEAFKFIDSLELFSLLANVADTKSLVIHPASTTHSQCSQEELEQQNIKPNTVRLSIGIENIDDILFDLENALNQI